MVTSKEEPVFLYDEFKDQELALQKQLDKIHSKKIVKDAYHALILKRFVLELYRAKQNLSTHSEKKEKTSFFTLVHSKDLNADIVKGTIVKQGNEFSYIVFEPPLNEKERYLLNSLKYIDLRKITKEELYHRVKTSAKKLKIVFSPFFFEKIRYYLIRDLVEFGEIDPLMRDSFITKIVCKGTQKPLRVEYRGKEMPTNIVFRTVPQLNHCIVRIGKKFHMKVNEDDPLLKVNLPNLKIYAHYGSEFIQPKFVIKKN